MRIHRLLAVLSAAVLSSSSLSAQIVQWDALSLPRAYAYRLAVSPEGFIYSIGDSVLYKSTNDGLTWSPVGVFSKMAQAIAFDRDGRLFAGNDAFGLFRSTDGGITWSNSLVTEGCNSFAVHPNGFLFAGLTYTGNGKVHRSTNNGETWSWVQLPNATNSFATQCFVFGNNGDVFAGSIDGFFRSTDLGVSWTQSNTGLNGRHVRVMAITPNQDIYLYTLFSSSVDGLYRSTNRGDTWVRVGLPPYFSSLVSSSSGVLFGASGPGVHTSTDNGQTWVDISGNIGTSHNLVSIIITPMGHLITGGYDVFRSRSVLTGATPAEVQPVSFRLMQNYPNPFNPATNIEFQIANFGLVTLKVFDLLGREVATLVNEVMQPGGYERVFEAQGLASGVYLYRLEAGGAVQARKLVLMR